MIQRLNIWAKRIRRDVHSSYLAACDPCGPIACPRLLAIAG
ncbi:hypothetical protein BOSE21B_150055 [Bosea sp. 21B]|nr:hypothetical protein BOSE21B_150055 [Bosea sp. 21B]CAD5300727.1 hypothetical protein BOSE7B_90084 [Bosea sp. 7B]